MDMIVSFQDRITFNHTQMQIPASILLLLLI